MEPLSPEGVHAVVGLGSSLGDREGALRLAVQALDAASDVEVTAVSRLWMNQPVGAASRPFLNAAVRLYTTRSARGLLALCKHLEARLGRVPSARWADRAVDLDLLLYGDRVKVSPALTLPHPRLHERPFALVPAAEVAPELVHPILGRDLRGLAAGREGGLIPVGALAAPRRRFSLAARSSAQYTGGRLGRRSVGMKLFLDTANLDEITEASSWGILSGVTTNPSLIARERRPLAELVHEICETVRGPVSVEVVASDADGMIQQGRLLARIHEHVVVKVPIGVAGLKATRALSADGVDVNVTLVFSAAQALLASEAGAAYVSPFVGRLDDHGEDGVGVVQQMAAVLAAGGPGRAVVLAASVRNPQRAAELARAGAAVATIPFNVLAAMVEHPLTDRGLATFMADWAAGPDPDLSGQVSRWLAERGR